MSARNVGENGATLTQAAQVKLNLAPKVGFQTYILEVTKLDSFVRVFDDR
jgi:hypothetical protein